ncbi:hypothetical protein H1C71_015124 [Ictidomys tridecemlineatus]|nr:hypothetical protein H1C71_015124 [Ictidomys tridecemlineatus]
MRRGAGGLGPESALALRGSVRLGCSERPRGGGDADCSRAAGCTARGDPGAGAGHLGIPGRRRQSPGQRGFSLLRASSRGYSGLARRVQWFLTVQQFCSAIVKCLGPLDPPRLAARPQPPGVPSAALSQGQSQGRARDRPTGAQTPGCAMPARWNPARCARQSRGSGNPSCGPGGPGWQWAALDAQAARDPRAAGRWPGGASPSSGNCWGRGALGRPRSWQVADQETPSPPSFAQGPTLVETQPNSQRKPGSRSRGVKERSLPWAS